MVQPRPRSPPFAADYRNGIGSGNGCAVRLPPMNAIEILRETVRVLRADPHGFTSILFFLLCPASACLLLSAAALDAALVLPLGRRLLLAAAAAGLPLTHLVRQLAHHLAATLVAALVSAPAVLTLLLAARAAAAYAVAAVYAGKPLAAGDLALLARRSWRRLAATYVLACASVLTCLAAFLALLVTACSTLKALLYQPDVVVCAGLITVLAFSVAYAHTVIVCNLAGVIAVLEDVAGVNALLRSVRLVRGQTQVGLLIFLGSTIGLAFVEGLFEHRVKTLSYGDGSSRLWEGPLLVLMYSFVMLIDSMMSAVFYFTCRSSSMELLDVEQCGSADELEMMVSSKPDADR